MCVCACVRACVRFVCALYAGTCVCACVCVFVRSGSEIVRRKIKYVRLKNEVNTVRHRLLLMGGYDALHIVPRRRVLRPKDHVL